MATSQSTAKGSETVEEVIAAQEAAAALRNQQLKDLALAALSGAVKLAGMAFIGAIAGYSAGIASENYRTYKARKEREQGRGGDNTQSEERR